MAKKNGPKTATSGRKAVAQPETGTPSLMEQLFSPVSPDHPIFKSGYMVGMTRMADSSTSAATGSSQTKPSTPSVKDARIPPDRTNNPDEESFQEATDSWKHRIGRHLPRNRP